MEEIKSQEILEKNIEQPSDKNIVVIELIHMLYNCGMILDKLASEDTVDFNIISQDSRYLMYLGDRYTIKLKEILGKCDLGTFNPNSIDYDKYLKDEEIQGYINLLSESIKKD